MVHIYNEITIYFYKAFFPSGASQRGCPPSALPCVEECTYFWGVNTSWGINMDKRKDLRIKKIIRLHNQHQGMTRRRAMGDTCHVPIGI
jgi:hypothetical protein